MWAFSIKLWWRFREQKSLWALHMMEKYCHGKPAFSPSMPAKCSPTWRRLVRIWATAHPHIHWIIGEGASLFWDDVWVDDKPLRSRCFDDRGSAMTKVSDLWEDGEWSTAKLQLLHDQAGLPQSLINDILQVPILAGEKDLPRWDLSAHGNFTTASRWNLGRAQQPTIPLLEDLWNKSLTPSISISIWRLLSNRIPVDTKLQWRHISLASMCLCCSPNPDVESLQHLFIIGIGAVSVWKEFDRWFTGNQHQLTSSDTILDRMEK